MLPGVCPAAGAAARAVPGQQADADAAALAGRQCSHRHHLHRQPCRRFAADLLHSLTTPVQEPVKWLLKLQTLFGICGGRPSLLSNRAVGCTDAAENTRAALHFANAAKRVQTQPKINEVVNSKALLLKMQSEISSLRRQLVRCSCARTHVVCQRPGCNCNCNSPWRPESWHWSSPIHCMTQIKPRCK